jgi:CheY-like chemotaxis protein
MKIVKRNPAVALQRLLSSVRENCAGWHGFLFTPPLPPHDELIKPPEHINGHLHKINKRSEALAAMLAKKTPETAEGSLFPFSGGVFVVLVRADMRAEYTEAAAKSGIELARLIELDPDGVAAMMGPRQKRMAVYEAIADTEKVKGIDFRRNRHKNGLILVADDDNFTGVYVANLLKNDYDVVVVRDGEDAICAFIRHAPNLVLLDIHIPGMEGHQTLRTLRILDPDAHVVMITADPEDNHIFDAARAGAVGFLRKPLAREKLLKTIREAPGMKRFDSAG